MKRPLLPLLTLLAAACSGKPPLADGGAATPNICNSQSDAQSDPRCQLTAGKAASYYIDHVGKTLWLSLTLPQQLDAKSLFSLQAGYNPQIGSPVQLAIVVVTAANAAVVPRAADDHDPGPPGEIQMADPLPANLAGQTIFILCSDDGNHYADPNDPFTITASVIEDPDPNQIGVPTAVTLSPPDSNGVQQGSPNPTGVLSTPGRVDEYAIAIPGSVQRPILYFSLTVPSEAGDGGILAPPLQYLMGYTLYDCGSLTPAACAAGGGGDGGVVQLVASDHMPNQLLVVDLDTARLVHPGDTYLLEVAGWQDPSSATPPQGDVRATYQLDVEVLPDTDPYDDPANPFQVTGLSVGGGAVTLAAGRLSHAGQVDLFSVPLSAQGENTRLHYVFTPSPTGTVGRFPALSEVGTTPPLRTAVFYTPVAAATGSDPGANCRNDWSTCPNDTANLPATAPLGIVDSYCDADGGPFCLYSYRQEDTQDFSNLQNFEGIIPVQKGTRQVYLAYQDQGGKWADDTPYTLALTWLPEGSENQSGYHWSEGSALGGGTLTADVPPQNFPNPPTAPSYSGDITVGNSLTSNNVPTLHGTNDYDAIPSTLDVWEFDIPPSVFNAAFTGETWELAWQIQNGQSGSPPCTLVVQPFFCRQGGGCDGPPTPDPFDFPPALEYQSGQIGTWYGAYEVTWSQSTTQNAGFTTDTVQGGGCYCFDPTSVAGGKLYLFVSCRDRTNYADLDIPYTIQTAVTTYPQAFPDGGCPASDAGIPDGGTAPIVTGCKFQQSRPSCLGAGDQCRANAECCSGNCSLTNVSASGGLPSYGNCQ